jgi:immunoglobulin-binding protein 1
MEKQPESLMERYLEGVTLSESNPVAAVPLLESVMKDVAALSIFSSNEALEDISTKSLTLLAVEHYLALALTSLPSEPGKISQRKQHLIHSFDLWNSFLSKLERLELLKKDEEKEFQELLEEIDPNNNTLPPPNRDAKIARFKAKQNAKKEVERLKSLRERRGRLEASPEDEMDGFDEESLERSVALTDLEICKSEALENWASAKRELPMIEMMVKLEEERQSMARHQGKDPQDLNQRPPPSNKPLQLTHITKDPAGKIQVKREEIKSKVFRPSWNQPTMTLEQLGEIEYKQAMEREERQKQAEAERVHEPKRYNDLLRDGLEDDSNLVDASAKLDRDWDDWKDENPRGSGNKRSELGDRNF